MSKAISFQVETQTEDNQIISLAHINEKLVALEVSEDANILFIYEKLMKYTYHRIDCEKRIN